MTVELYSGWFSLDILSDVEGCYIGQTLIKQWAALDRHCINVGSAFRVAGYHMLIITSNNG